MSFSSRCWWLSRSADAVDLGLHLFVVATNFGKERARPSSFSHQLRSRRTSSSLTESRGSWSRSRAGFAGGADVLFLTSASIAWLISCNSFWRGRRNARSSRCRGCPARRCACGFPRPRGGVACASVRAAAVARAGPRLLRSGSRPGRLQRWPASAVVIRSSFMGPFGTGGRISRSLGCNERIWPRKVPPRAICGAGRVFDPPRRRDGAWRCARAGGV